jgi:prepilin-type N-terminal cleavage/methylation domain-containing protein
MKTVRKTQRNWKGFSLLELLIVVSLLSLIMGAVLSQIGATQQRSRAEQASVDIFQESREFADQLMRDVHQTGYPSIHMFDTSSWTTAVASPSYNDTRLATGITLISASELTFEGDLDGTGNVSIVDYRLVAAGNKCPCLQRSQGVKPATGTLSNELQNVQSAGTSADPIFVGYDASGTAIAAADLTTAANRNLLASLKTVQWQIKIKSPTLDTQTGLAPETTLHGQAVITNCSLAATLQANSCQAF